MITSILFVCTGNIFRSVSAEYALKHHLGPETTLRIASAGTRADQGEGHWRIHEYLDRKGIASKAHRPRRVSARILAEHELVVAMGEDHRARLREEFGRDSVLFNELCHGLSTPVLDLHEAVDDWLTNERAAWDYIYRTIDYIWASSEGLAETLRRSG
ncbi:MAG: low molecular weight phosphatase family protein [Gammaproteobacteria bacterium]|nr:low molecular weight phosphatase family protein [Gammaproteobacteria bacterium]